MKEKVRHISVLCKEELEKFGKVFCIRTMRYENTCPLLK